MLSARILENPEPDVLSARHASASRIDDHHEDRHLCCCFSAQLMLQQQPNRLLKSRSSSLNLITIHIPKWVNEDVIQAGRTASAQISPKSPGENQAADQALNKQETMII